MNTYSSKKEPVLTLEVLQEVKKSIPKRPKMPERVFYSENPIVDEAAFYRFCPTFTGFNIDHIAFNPKSKAIILDLFKELGIKLIPFKEPFNWCLLHRIKNSLPKENYDEFWNEMCNASKLKATEQAGARDAIKPRP